MQINLMKRPSDALCQHISALTGMERANWLLTHWGLVMPYDHRFRDNVQVDDLLPDGTEPFTWTNLDLSPMGFHGTHPRRIFTGSYRDINSYESFETMKLVQHILGTNKLICGLIRHSFSDLLDSITNTNTHSDWSRCNSYMWCTEVWKKSQFK